MKKSILVIFLMFCVSCQTSNKAEDSYVAVRAPSSELQAVHNALFELFFPLEKIKDKPELVEIYNQTNSQLWQNISQRQDVLFGLRILDLSSLLQGGFVHMSVPEREKKFRNFETSPLNNVRKAARFLRLFYIYSIYSSELGSKISGMPRTPVVRPDIDDFLKQNPLLLPSNLSTYDREQKVLSYKKSEAFDFIIIGAGPAGSVLAYELTQKGKSVLLLEQGSFVHPLAVDSRRIMNLHESLGMRTSEDGGIIFRNGNAVGGGTAINVDLAFSPLMPIIQNRIESWRNLKLIGEKQWDQDEMNRAYSWIKEKVGTRRSLESEINANNRILWEGSLNAGRKPSLYDLNTYTTGSSPSPVLNKKSSVDTFVLPALLNANNPLTLISGAKVRRILWSHQKDSFGNQIATGVEFEKVSEYGGKGNLLDIHKFKIMTGDTVKVVAKNVVLSAGTMGSPIILKNSGLLNPNIGLAPVAHPSIPLIGIFDHSIRIWEGTPSSVFNDDQALKDGTILEAMTADVSYAAMMMPGNREQIYNLVKQIEYAGGFGVLLIDQPNAKNKIYLDNEGKTQILFSLSESDKRRFVRAISEAAKIMFNAGAKKVFIPSNELSVFELTSIEQTMLIDKELKLLPNRTTLTSAHLQGSCKMGSSAKSSVVDQNHKVWSTNNVFVVDGSVFPTSVGANPMQSIYTIGKIFADKIR